jgi:DNA invertase Pin-like site-specific DNA recombinase
MIANCHAFLVRPGEASRAKELRDYCVRRGWKKVVEYSDKSSGAKFTRSGLDALMHDVRRGRIEAVVAYKLDRLGRSLPHLAQLISEMRQRIALRSSCPVKALTQARRILRANYSSTS